MATKKRAKKAAVAQVAREEAPPSLIEHLHERVAEAVTGFPKIVRRRLLRSQGWFVNGNVFTLVNMAGRIVVRCPVPAVQDELLALPGAACWQLRNKPPMRGWLLLPEAMHEDDEALAAWLRRAFVMTRDELPAKGAKPKKAAPKKAAPKNTKRAR